MAYLSEKFNGYIADNPNIDFIRCDGKVFSYDEVNTASVTASSNSLTINGGWSNFPLATIDTDKTLEVNFTSSQFNLDLFQLSLAQEEVEEGDKGVVESKRYEVETGLKVTLPFEVNANSVKISGLTEAGTVAEGKFKVAITAATEEADGKTEITFNTGDVTVGDTIRVSYRRRVVSAGVVSALTNGTTAKGELFMHFPVYSDGSDLNVRSFAA